MGEGGVPPFTAVFRKKIFDTILYPHHHNHHPSIVRQRLIEVSLSSGNYSRLLADVQFTRSMGYYMIQVSMVTI